MSRNMRSKLGLALDDGFALVKLICDDADTWSEKKLGHHYVGINNKTIEIRSLWRRWEQLSETLASAAVRHRPMGGAGGGLGTGASAVETTASVVAAAMEHFNDKLTMCRDRLGKYRKRGLFLRTAFTAAHKVMKVLVDVHAAHLALLGMGDEAMALLGGDPASPVAVKNVVGSSGGGAQPLTVRIPGITPPRATTMMVHSTQTEVEAGARAHVQLRGSDMASDVGGQGGSVRGGLRNSPLGMGSESKEAARARVSSLGAKAGVTAPVATWDRRGSMGGDDSPDSSPGNSNPLARGGFVMHIPASSGGPSPAQVDFSPQQQQQPQHEWPGAAEYTTTEVTAYTAAQRSPQASQSTSRDAAAAPLAPVRGPSSTLAPTVLILGSDGMTELNGIRYAVSWLPPEAGGSGANAVLVPIPEWAGRLDGAPTLSNVSRGGAALRPFPGQEGIWSPFAPALPRDPASLGADGATDRDQSEKREIPLSPLSLAHALASANLTEEAAKQLLAAYSPGSATAAIRAKMGHRASPREEVGVKIGSGASASRSPDGGVVGPAGKAAAAASGPVSRRSSGPVAFHPDLIRGPTASAPMSRRASTVASRQLSAAMERAAAEDCGGDGLGIVATADGTIIGGSSRRSLWYRLPPPSGRPRRSYNPPAGSSASPGWGWRTNMSPILGSRVQVASGARLSPSPGISRSLSSAAAAVRFQRTPSPSPLPAHSAAGLAATGGIRHRLGHQADVANAEEASRRKLEQIIEECIVPTSSAVQSSLMASRYVRQGGRRGAESMVMHPTPGHWKSPSAALRVSREPMPHPRHSLMLGGGGEEGLIRATSSPGGIMDAGLPPATNFAQLRSASVGGIPSPLHEGMPDPEDETGAGANPEVWGRAYAATLSSRVRQGDLAAIEELAHGVRFGLPGLPAQPEVARGLMTIAAQSGSAAACIALGEMFRTGEGGGQDKAEAEAWLQQGRRLEENIAGT